jgi:hypothetical protein
MEHETLEFDSAINLSHLGRRVKVRDAVTSDSWSHGFACYADMSETLKDVNGDGVLRQVEEPTGGYQLLMGGYKNPTHAMEELGQALNGKVSFFKFRV